jgi:hypothetical protein
MSAPKAPFVVRWRNGVMDDPNPVLTWKALVAATALTRYANVRDGRDCYPGASTCARVMRVSVDTIKRGWAELVQAGWLEIKPLPASRRREQGALKVLRFPTRGLSATKTLSASHVGADSHPTFPGNQGTPSGSLEGSEASQSKTGEPERDSRRVCRKHPELDLEGWDFCGECEREKYEATYGRAV